MLKIEIKIDKLEGNLSKIMYINFISSTIALNLPNIVFLDYTSYR